MNYNTQRKKLPLPEYGRGIQEMVDYALTLPTKGERQRCANTIVSIMGNMFPHLRDVPDFKHKLWDHLAIMAEYKLDIDYPYEIIPQKEGIAKPEPMAYPMKKIKYHHYGYLLESLTKKMEEMPDGPEREELAMMVACQMKKCLNGWNKDAMDDDKVVSDLEAYTNGMVHLDKEKFQKVYDFYEKNQGGRYNVTNRNNTKKNKRKN